MEKGLTVWVPAKFIDTIENGIKVEVCGQEQIFAKTAVGLIVAKMCHLCGEPMIPEDGYESGGSQGWVVVRAGGCPTCLRNKISEMELEATNNVQEIKVEVEKVRKQIQEIRDQALSRSS